MFSITAQNCPEIFVHIVDKIKEGNNFIPDVKYPEIIGGNLLVEFIDAIECGRSVRRVIFPDQNGLYKGDAFKAQFNQENLGEEEI